ncbi:MAG: DUF805 domain-containing protein [Victivallaceae bacterium]|nr:DUF805 domain-containing protein [Victivallaceae bacterium]
MNGYLDVLKKYAVFEGRADRKEFWIFWLFNFVIGMILGIIGKVIGMGGFLSGIYTLAVLIPVIAVTIRRLHDTGRSGWWILISFVPIIGSLVVLVLCALESQPGLNQYGPNPKEIPELEVTQAEE